MGEEVVTRETLGMKHNSYWNIKSPPNSKGWLGQTGEDSVGHAIFRDPAYACRATVKQLYRYFTTGAVTLRAVFERWAPSADENDPQNYAEFVGGRMNLGIDEPIGIFNVDGTIADDARLKAMLLAMAEMENFAGFEVPEKVIIEGVGLYLSGVT